jgi:multidrug resistance efflux pump
MKKHKEKEDKHMKSKIILSVSILLLGVFLIAGCDSLPALPGQATEEAEATEIPIVIADTEIISEGRLVPNQYVNLSFKSGGQVVELLVEEGEVVDEGQVMARLGNREQLEAAVAATQVELLNAEQARDKLFENSDVSTALAYQAVTDARDALRDGERYRNNLLAGSRQTDIDTARADVIVLKERLDDARADYKEYENKTDDNLKRAALLSKFAEAQQRYDNAVRLLNNLQGSPSELDTTIAEANVSVAEASLALAELEYEKVKDGPDPDQLSVVEARISAAQANLAAAESALDNIELVAPIAGTIVDLDIKLGEQVAPGQPVVVLADFSQWAVETDDLTEIEVPDISIVQAVTVTPDALPDLELSGTVESIKDIYEEKRGDITYTARIVLDESDPRLRWGMTVVVVFEE